MRLEGGDRRRLTWIVMLEVGILGRGGGEKNMADWRVVRGRMPCLAGGKRCVTGTRYMLLRERWKCEQERMETANDNCGSPDAAG
jgi:hypothetical protein